MPLILRTREVIAIHDVSLSPTGSISGKWWTLANGHSCCRWICQSSALNIRAPCFSETGTYPPNRRASWSGRLHLLVMYLAFCLAKQLFGWSVIIKKLVASREWKYCFQTRQDVVLNADMQMRDTWKQKLFRCCLNASWCPICMSWKCCEKGSDWPPVFLSTCVSKVKWSTVLTLEILLSVHNLLWYNCCYTNNILGAAYHQGCI
jgi:hypothetical protein